MANLASQYRPHNFSEVIGQDSTITILQNQLTTGDTKNAYLFVGPAGCGKTTTARILANELNGNNRGIIEIDGASNNGIENIRNLIEDARFKPMDTKNKIYVIDECFHENTLISTPSGYKRISEIKCGDTVYNMSGKAKVKSVFKNAVYAKRLCCVIVNQIKIITTVDHLFLTDGGWVEAQHLDDDTIVYVTEDMKNLWKKYCGDKVECDNSISNSICVVTKNESDESYMFQSRPLLTKDDNFDWCWSQYEKITVNRLQKSSATIKYKIDSVHIYKHGYNDELFLDYFSEIELESGTVTMYDLEIDGHPSYFANGVLVHNCHALSGAAWQSMLKILEEPPKYVVFILCTTDPQKIPGTILSRCQRFDYKKVSVDLLVDRLNYIINAENEVRVNGDKYTVVDDALHYIATLAEGGVRKAISLLDTCLSYKEVLTQDDVREILGTADYSVMLSLLNAITNKQDTDIINIIESLYNGGKDLKLFMQQFMEYLVDIQRYYLINTNKGISIPTSQLNDLTHINIDVMTIYKNVYDIYQDIKYETNCKYMIEGGLLLLCH